MGTTYTPVLHAKQAELHALAELGDQQNRLVPLVVMPDPTPGRNRRTPFSPLGDVKRRISDDRDGLVGCWSTNRPLLLDLGDVDPCRFDSAHGLFEGFFDYAQGVGLEVVPVTGRDRPQIYRDGVAAAVRQLDTGACVRLRNDELACGNTGVQFVLRELDLPRSSVDLVLDLGSLPSPSSVLLSGMVYEYLKRLAPLASWRSVSLVGTAFPPNLSQVVDHRATATLPRLEYDTWQRAIRRLEDGTVLRYGDYGVADSTKAPSFPGAANLRYALEYHWLVMRGDPPQSAPEDDYVQLAKELVQLGEWRGDDHCPGCAFIAERVSVGKGGSTTQWRQAGFAHHFAMVLEAL